MTQRVSDERLASLVYITIADGNQTTLDDVVLDLRDCRAEVERLKAERNEALAKVAALREVLEMLLKMSRGKCEHGYDEVVRAFHREAELVNHARKMLSDTAAAAAAHDERIRNERDEEYRKALGMEFADGSPLLTSHMNPEHARSIFNAMRESHDSIRRESRRSPR